MKRKQKHYPKLKVHIGIDTPGYYRIPFGASFWNSMITGIHPDLYDRDGPKWLNRELLKIYPDNYFSVGKKKKNVYQDYYERKFLFDNPFTRNAHRPNRLDEDEGYQQ